MNVKNEIKKKIVYFLNTQEIIEKVTFSRLSLGVQNVTFEGKSAVSDGCNFSVNIKIRYATTLGCNNLLGVTITIGKDSQLGVGVALNATNHPISYVITYIDQNLFEGDLKQSKEENKIIIGHDVWIGHGVVVVGNVIIGNVAILAAGSVITKNVAPSSILAGVPAKENKKRFSDTIIQEIEDLQWWDKSEEELEKIKPLFFKDFTNRHSIYE